MNVSVILVHYNTPKLLLNCLNSIYERTSGISFEVVIVDNASDHKPLPDQLTSFQRMTWIQNTENKGFGEANNIGVRKAKGDYVFLLNTDTILTSNIIKELYCRAGGIDNLGILGPRLMNQDGSVQFYGSILGRFQYMGVKDRPVSFISGAAMFLKKKVFNAVKGFDPTYFFYNEDIDLCATLRKSGYKLVYTPSQTLIHLGGGSTKKSKSLKKQAIQSSWYFFKKHYLSFKK